MCRLQGGKQSVLFLQIYGIKINNFEITVSRNSYRMAGSFTVSKL
jgi:hypothetical protein